MIRRSTRREKQKYYVLQVLQWLIFAVMIFLAFISSTAGHFIKPILLIPLALCISAQTGEIQAMAVGMVCGVLADIAAGKLIGFQAILLVSFCVLVSLLHQYVLRHKLLNTLALTAACVAVQEYLNYTFYYAVWGIEDISLLLLRHFLPEALLTIGSAVLLHFLVNFIARRCGGGQNRKELEKTVLSAYRE